VVWRDKSDLPEDLIFRVNYLGGDMPTFALNFSRPGGENICQYYLFLRLGREGYQRIHNACYATAQHLSSEIEKLGPFRIIYNGRGGIPALSFTLKDEKKAGFSLYDLPDRLRSRGWQIAAYSMLPNREDLVVMRILVRHGFSRDLGNLLLEDFKRSLDYFKAHPSAKPLEEHETAGHNHSGRGVRPILGTR
jgi:glutamate decarboxylase